MQKGHFQLILAEPGCCCWASPTLLPRLATARHYFVDLHCGMLHVDTISDAALDPKALRGREGPFSSKWVVCQSPKWQLMCRVWCLRSESHTCLTGQR